MWIAAILGFSAAIFLLVALDAFLPDEDDEDWS